MRTLSIALILLVSFAVACNSKPKSDEATQNNQGNGTPSASSGTSQPSSDVNGTSGADANSSGQNGNTGAAANDTGATPGSSAATRSGENTSGNPADTTSTGAGVTPRDNNGKSTTSNSRTRHSRRGSTPTPSTSSNP